MKDENGIKSYPREINVSENERLLYKKSFLSYNRYHETEKTRILVYSLYIAQ